MAATPGYIPAGAYWNEIQLAASNRAGTAAVWQAISVAHLEATGNVARFSFSDVNAAYSRAVRNRRAVEAFAALPQTGAIGPEHVGAILNAPVSGVPQQYRRYLAKFTHTVLTNGEEQQHIRTYIFRAGLDATKQSILNHLNSFAADLAEEYENELHVGISDVSLLAG